MKGVSIQIIDRKANYDNIHSYFAEVCPRVGETIIISNGNSFRDYSVVGVQHQLKTERIDPVAIYVFVEPL